MTLSGVVDFASLSLLLSLSRFFFLSFAKKGVCLKKRPNNVFGFFPLRTGKGAALLRTHHHRSPHLTHSTGVLKCALPKKEEGRSSLLDVFFHKKKREIFWWVPFARRRLLCSRIQRHEKKTEKRTQKTLYFTLPKTYWVSPKLQKSDDDDDERGTVHTRPIDRRPPREETLVFLTRARERERERRFPPRVSLSNAPDSSSHPFSSPPNTSSVGFKFSIETPTTLPVAVAR